jgi:CRP/FNR family cyclic AMP-dependent transcriptional regulator
MESVDLETIPLFAGLAREDRDRVAAVARRLRWNPGHVVVKEGEFAFDLYAIKEGAAEVQQGGERVSTLGSGDFFGELGVVRGNARRWPRRRSASVVITAPSDAIAIDGSDVRRLVADIPALREALLAAAEKYGRTQSAEASKAPPACGH